MNINLRMFYLKCRQYLPKAVSFRNMATIKRFYRRTNILASGDKFEITLDQRKLKTPKGKVLEVPSKPLALAIALEWDSQEDTINRSNMHLIQIGGLLVGETAILPLNTPFLKGWLLLLRTFFRSTFLDNPHQHTRVDIANYIANYLETDTVLFHSSETDELYKIQAEKWDPIIQWFCNRYQVDIAKTQSINPPDVPLETKASIIRHMSSYSEASLQGFLYSVDTLKSVILTLAISERKISVEEAVSLSRLEEEFQISHWGNVEWSHELSKYDLQARLAAATLFIHLNSYTATSQQRKERSTSSSV